MSDHYRTIAARVEFRHKIERSEFLGIAFPIASDDEFFAEIERIQKRFHDATHHCWAFRLFADARARSSDAGEPSGTAGKPILAAIEGADLYDLAVVVVRWFGGVKLGTGGLSRAYRETVAETLRAAVVADRYLYERVRVVVPFDALGSVYRLVHPPDVVLVEEKYGERNEFVFEVRRSMIATFKARLREMRLTMNDER
ncbi:MAG TPA: YigZ family protein [Thermoanaerobaculia bacterium]|nr:YigZ family protein [Thermoanaerobaculia bacterium]